MRQNDKSTGVDSNNESTGIKSELDSTGATDEANKMELIEGAIEEAERCIAEGSEILAGTEAKTEDTKDENVIHPGLHIPTEDHTYNFCKRGNQRPDYTHRYGFQAAIIHYTLTQLSCFSPRWYNLPSGHQRYSLKEINLGYM